MPTRLSHSIVPPLTVTTPNLVFLLTLKQGLNVLIATLGERRACHGNAGSILGSTVAEASSTPEHSKVVPPRCDLFKASAH